ncbi:Hypothetical_protein [Hexamita inflata]|uniref:Hypothetical_protein n=1 Tax=Hexamita inflata TaxID=28002 RepID=A0AA86NV63_9EUKA|nr:Hypothetical protein HINF_LOCUS13044 [Hexamita inflata]
MWCYNTEAYCNSECHKRRCAFNRESQYYCCTNSLSSEELFYTILFTGIGLLVVLIVFGIIWGCRKKAKIEKMYKQIEEAPAKTDPVNNSEVQYSPLKNPEVTFPEI